MWPAPARATILNVTDENVDDRATTSPRVVETVMRYGTGGPYRLAGLTTPTATEEPYAASEYIDTTTPATVDELALLFWSRVLPLSQRAASGSGPLTAFGSADDWTATRFGFDDADLGWPLSRLSLALRRPFGTTGESGSVSTGESPP